MTIERVENPATGEEIIVVKGVVDQVFIKALDAPDRFQNTHKASIRIGDDWVNNISLKVKDGYDPQIRFNNGNQAKPDWVNLDVGDNVRIVVTESEYNGKIYYNSGTSKIKLVKKGENVPTKDTNGGTTREKFKPKDMSGIEIGHALNVAINVVGSLDDPQAIIDAAKEAHTLTVALKKEYAEKNPDASAYDIGASTGQAILSASHYVDSVADIEFFARQTLDTIVPAVSAFVKGEGESKPDTKKPAAKKSSAKKATAKKEETETDEEYPDLGFHEDDVPF